MKHPESPLTDYLTGPSLYYPSFRPVGERAEVSPEVDFFRPAYDFSQKILDVFLAHPQKKLLADESLSLRGQEALSLMFQMENFLEQMALPGARVAVLFPPSAIQALSILAVMYSGRVPVIFNHWTKKEDLKRICKERHIHALFCEPGQEMSLDIPVLQVKLTGEISSADTKKAYIERPLPHPDTGLVLFTSGSMGEPKAVALSRKGLMYNIDTLIKYFGLDAQTVSAITLPIFHTMALNTHFFPTFFSGGTSVFVNSELSMGRIYRSIIECQGTFVALIGDMLKLCLKEMEKRGVQGGECVEHIQMSGGITRVEHLHMAKKLFPRATIHKGFGLTELIRISMINSRDPDFYDETVGRVLPGQDVVIKDEQGRILPKGQQGQIFVKGDNVMMGYEGVASFDQPFDDRGYLATGDYGILTPDKRLYFYGRIDGTFKSQGRRISAMEIEQVALNHPAVTAAFCIPVACEVKGLRPVLFLELNEREDLMDKEEKNHLEALLKENLEAYKVPREIILSSQLPRLPNKKVNKKMLETAWTSKTSFEDFGHAVMGMKFFKM